VFEEYHYETGGGYGTVVPKEDTGIIAPDEILLLEHLPGSWDNKTDKEVFFDKPVKDGGKGWCWRDTGESDSSIFAVVKANKTLFEFLMKVERELGLR